MRAMMARTNAKTEKTTFIGSMGGVFTLGARNRRLLRIEGAGGGFVSDRQHALAQRILIRPQRLRHALIHNDRARDSRLIRLRQQAALKKRNAGQRKVAG